MRSYDLSNIDKVNQIAIFLITVICFTYTFPRWADPNQNSRLDGIVAFVEDGTFRIDKYVNNTVDYAKVGEHYYSDKAPGVMFIGIPVYAILKTVLALPVVDQITEHLARTPTFLDTLNPMGSGLSLQKVRFAVAQWVIAFVVGVIPSALISVLLYRLSGYFAVRRVYRVAVAIGYGLLTPAFPYTDTLYGHQLSAALLFGAFYVLFPRGKSLSIWELVYTGLLLGYSVVTEYPAILIAAILFAYATYRLFQLREPRKLIWVILSGMVVAALMMIYNTVVFGGPFRLGYGYSELWQPQHETGLMSLTYPHWEAIWGITFSLFRGIFILSPILLLSLPGLVVWLRSRHYRSECLVVLGSTLIFFIFNSSSIMWWGGFAIGPRYLLPTLPLMVAPIAFVLQRWGSKTWFRITCGALSAWSVIAVWSLTLAGQAYPSDMIRNPLLDYAGFNWLRGNIARNLGTLFGLPGASSLLPLVLFSVAFAVIWWLTLRHLPAAGMLVRSHIDSSRQPEPSEGTLKLNEWRIQ